MVGQPAGEHGVAAGFVDLVEQRQQLIGDGVRGVEATADHSQWEGAVVNSGGRTAPRPGTVTAGASCALRAGRPRGLGAVAYHVLAREPLSSLLFPVVPLLLSAAAVAVGVAAL